MEYEIESEAALFDFSTNPSLEPRAPAPVRHLRPKDTRRRQKAEAIPDEEDQAA